MYIYYRIDILGYEWNRFGDNFCNSRCTNSDGRCPGLLTAEEFLPGIYKMTFDTGSYFKQTERKGFYPHVDASLNYFLSCNSKIVLTRIPSYSCE